MQAATFIQVIEERQELMISCVEEIAYRMGFISSDQLENLAKPLRKNGYGKYLLSVLESEAARP
ncbi:MAG: hypothetical protein WAL98_19800 [Desulfatiglandaceae bacterium]